MTKEEGKVRVLALKSFKFNKKQYKFFNWYEVTESVAENLKEKRLVMIKRTLPSSEVKE